ncbi:hypothetical protein O0544_23180 [Edwardsiella anguillarum]|nr:hypothetical protein [Edwardsiella anguillarum]
MITVQDVEKTLAFYVAGLGMSLDSRNGRLALTFGNQKSIFTVRRLNLPRRRKT